MLTWHCRYVTEAATEHDSFWGKTFGMLDVEPTDLLLDGSELERLVNMAQMVLGDDNSCGQSLLDRCDLTGDGRLSLREWNTCFRNGNQVLPIE